MNTITTLKAYTQNEQVFSRYLDLVGNRNTAQMYIGECLLTVANSKDLQRCTPQSIISASLRCVTLGLHLDLDQAYLVPFKDQCTQITGYKGMRDLAIRTNKYRILHAAPIKAGWMVKHHPITGTAEHVREDGAPAGVVAYFEMFGGFAKSVYMTLPEIHAHAAQYSKSYTWAKSTWKASERSKERMEVKTVFRRLMLEWGYMDPIAQRLITTEEDQQPDESLPSAEGINVTEEIKPKRTAETNIKDLGF